MGISNCDAAYHVGKNTGSGEGDKALIDIETEQAILGACIMYPNELIDEVVISLDLDCFCRQDNRLVFDAIRDLYARNEQIDLLAVVDTLRSSGNLEKIAAGQNRAGKLYVSDLCDNSGKYLAWRRHIKILQRYSLLRGLSKASVSINALAHDAPDDTNEVVDEAEKILFEVTEKSVKSEFIQVKELVPPTIENLCNLVELGEKVVGVPSGFVDIDKKLHGFRAGDLITLAARPGIGKTSLALNIALSAAKAGTTVAYFSLEMHQDELVERLLAADLKIPLSHIRSLELCDKDLCRFKEAKNNFNCLDFAIDDGASLSSMGVRAKARRQLHRVGEEGKSSLVIIDYLQLMRSSVPRKDGNRNLEIGDITRSLKIMAKELDVPVLVLSQLSRAVETRSNKRPLLSDLRDSGSIEQDSDIVMFLDRSMTSEEAGYSNRPDLNKANLIIAKHRNGPIGDVTLGFEPEFTCFGDNTYYDDIPVCSTQEYAYRQD